MTEIPFARVAHYYSQHDYGPNGWQRTVSRGRVTETATKYIVVPPVEQAPAHLQDTLVVHEVDKNTIRLELPNDLSSVETVVLLAKTALSEYERERDAVRREVKVIAHAPYSLENPETNPPTSEVFVKTLGLTGDSFTDSEIVYTGTLRESLGAIDDTLEWRLGRGIMRSAQLPELPGKAA